MNILFVNATRSWGGIKTWMLRLGQFLRERGHHIVFACRAGDDLVNHCRESNLQCYPLKFGADYSPVAIARFLRLLSAEKIDIIITNTSKEIRTAAIAAKMMRIPHVNRLGLYGDVRDKFRVRYEYRWLVDKIIVPSQSLLHHFSRFPFMKGKIRVMNNSVHAFPYSATENRRVKFAVVANLSARKQIDKVLHAFSSLPDNLDWEFHIGGFGPEVENLMALQNTLGLSERVHFHGKITEPYSFLKEMDVGILYSTRETFPNSILEYMTMSCAPIVSDIDGVTEMITHETDGLIVNPADTQDLAGAIQLLIEDEALRQKLAYNANHTIKQKYSIHKRYREIEYELQQTKAEYECNRYPAFVRQVFQPE